MDGRWQSGRCVTLLLLPIRKSELQPRLFPLTWLPPDDLETTEAAGRRGLTQKRGRTFGPQRPRRGARAPHLADVTRSGGAQ